MKEAAGEANMTVITIVLIAIVLGVGTIIVSGLMKNTDISAACTSAGGTMNGGKCWAHCNRSSSGVITGCGNALDCRKVNGSLKCSPLTGTGS